MKTRARLILEKRFRQWTNGKTLAAVSAAALLGLALSAQPASALFIVDCPDESGYGGPVVRVHVNGNLALTNAVVVTFDPETGAEIDTPVSAVLCLTPGAVDGNGKPYINLLGPAGDGVYTDPLSGNTVTISAIPNRTAVPRVFVDKGNGGVSLMAATDLLATADLGPDTLTLQLDSQAHFGDVGGGLHTYGVNMDGTVLGRTPAAVVSVTGQAVLQGEGESTDTVNHNPADLNADVGPSLFAGVAPVPLKPGGLFTGAVTEDIVCGTANVEFPTCALQIRNTIDIAFSRAGETVYSSGSFAGGVTTDAGGGPAGMRLLLNKTGVPFDTFSAAVLTQSWRDTFELGALFKLGPLSAGINPPAATPGDKFHLVVGGFDQSFALNSFVKRRFLGITFYALETFVNGVPFKAVITPPLFGNTWSLVAVGQGAGLTAATTLVDVTIGADKGGGEAKVARLPR